MVKFVFWEINIVYTVELQSMGRSLGVRDQRAGYGSQPVRFFLGDFGQVTPKEPAF